MLLSSVAEAMFWSGRYLERAQALARTIGAVERLSLDLPGRHALGLGPLLALVKQDDAQPDAEKPSQTDILRALALNGDDSSSVLGALWAARENLRQARGVVPPESWIALNNQYARLLGVANEPMPRVLDALTGVLEAGSQIEGELESGMARDAAYAFLNIGTELERAEMMLRVLAVLLPALTAKGWERTFDDVRWAGLLQALGVHSLYRRRHHHQVELSILLDFLLVDVASPRSVVHCLRRIENDLSGLPRSSQVRAAVTVATSGAFGLAHATPAEVDPSIEVLLGALASVHGAMQSAYFPELSAAARPSSTAQAAAHSDLLDPFEYLGREHAQIEAVLRVLDALIAQAAASKDVDKAEILAVVGFLTDFGELGHHEKEELLLTPRLVENGFDWSEGPVAAMRREHRHEHFFLRVLSQLASQRSAWSAEDRRRFVTDGHEFLHFLRSHMDHERRDLFEQAARSLPAQVKRLLAQAFVEFDAKQQGALTAAHGKVKGLLLKYGHARTAVTTQEQSNPTTTRANGPSGASRS